mgnify:CR=1 FL=1
MRTENRELTVNESGGLNLATVLTIVFVVLKLTGTITWSWLWVLCPLWIPFVFVTAIFLLLGIVKLIAFIVGCFLSYLGYFDN